MKHIHIVEPYHSAAMQRMSEPLHELSRLYEVTTSDTLDTAADLNIHVPFHTLGTAEELGNGKHIAVYTHCNPGSESLLAQACQRADIVTAMSFTGRQELLNYGVDPKKIWVIYCAADGFLYRKRIVSVIGYPQPNGRKRESILLDLAWKYDLSAFEFWLAGTMWGELASKLQSLGVEVKNTEHLPDEGLKTLYQVSSVFLSTGYMEGGPLPLLEAMACGVPVLSPRFGYAADLLDDDDLYDGADDLMGKLKNLTDKSLRYHQLARGWSWKDYAAEYALLIGRLLGESVDLFPERGVSRYAQLLDEIDEIKPSSICEIGTWNGHRAVQMLQQASKYHPMKRIRYQGFDLFEQQTGEQFTRELSKLAMPMEIVEKRIKATGAKVWLKAGDTYDTLEDDAPLGYDLYFIDGGHSEETIDNDGRYALSCLINKKTVLIFDDYYHEGKPEGVGCNKFIDALDKKQYEVTHLPARTRADDGRLIGMVRVKNADLPVPLPTETYTTSATWHERESAGIVYPMRLDNAPRPPDGESELERLASPSGE